jgi:hypothetical protein
MGFGVKERGITRSGELAFEALKGPVKNTRVGGHGESTIYGGSTRSMGSDNLANQLIFVFFAVSSVMVS